MKKNFLPAFIFTMFLSNIIIISYAQTGETKLGTSALANNTNDGIYNTGLGYYSLHSNTTGNKNTASGANTLRFNVSGNGLTANGYAALYKNKNGRNNTALGAYTLFENINGSYNTAIGGYSLHDNTGSFNTANGYNTLYKNTSGGFNTAIGYISLYSNTIGIWNTACGAYALYKNDGGGSNAAYGFNSLYNNLNGDANAAFGSNSLYSNQNGVYNAAFGQGALYFTSEDYNTGIGALSLYYNSSGHSNTATGYQSLYNNATGSNNTAFGYGADVTQKGLNNATAIGYNAKVNASNKVRIGNTAVTSIGGQVGWTTFSDGRYKRNIKENIPGLIFINSLRPVSYTVNIKGLNEYYNKGAKQVAGSNSLNNEELATMQKANEAAARITHSGFVAQEVEQAAKNVNYDFDGVDVPENKEDLYGLRYENFIVPLVKAVQELSKQNEELQKQIDELKTIIKGYNNINVTVSEGLLEQNIPNPFNHSTTIKYTLPKKFATAQIAITDMSGKILKQVTLPAGRQGISGSSNGSVNIDAATLSSGAYYYSLIIDGKITGTKQMLLAK